MLTVNKPFVTLCFELETLLCKRTGLAVKAGAAQFGRGRRHCERAPSGRSSDRRAVSMVTGQTLHNTYEYQFWPDCGLIAAYEKRSRLTGCDPNR